MMQNYKPKNMGTCIITDKDHQYIYILLHPDKPKWIVINKTGYKILSLCDGHKSVGEIAHNLSREYNISFDSVLFDIQSFIIRLVNTGFRLPLLPLLPITSHTETPHSILPRRNLSENIPPLKKVHLHITENCNLRCKHCGVITEGKKKNLLTTNQIFRIIDEAKEKEIRLLAITGGEPFLREDCLKILSYAAERVNIVVATNGTLINEHIAQVLSGLNLILQISLDGPKEIIHDFIRGKGAFARTMKALDLLCNRGANNKITLCVTLSRNNINHIPAILTLAVKKGISSVRFLPLQKMGSAEYFWDKLSLSIQKYRKFYNFVYQEVPVQYPELHISPGFQGFVLRHSPEQAMWCQIGQMVAIDAQGDLYPCPLLMEPPYRLGSIREISLQQVLESQQMKKIKEICHLRKYKIPACRGCLWKHFCQGGCPGSIYRSKGTFYAVDDLCEFRQKLYPQTILNLAAPKSCLSLNKIKVKIKNGS